MKKMTKKLVLAKETVRRLEAGGLQHVYGGTSLYCNGTALNCTTSNFPFDCDQQFTSPGGGC